MNTVVLISVDEIDARKICERVENTTIKDFDNDPNFKDLDPNDYEVYSLSDFMDMVNNQERDVLTNFFITFVNT